MNPSKWLFLLGCWCRGCGRSRSSRGPQRQVQVASLLALLVGQVFAQDIPAPSAADSLAVQTINAVLQVSRLGGNAVWPGYDLTRQPVVIYLPGQWSVALHCSTEIPGYGDYPDNWPALLAPARVHWGSVEGLVGQIAFNYEIGGLRTVALPFYLDVPEEYGPVQVAMFEFLVHEAFHQFQRSAFRDVETLTEEKYPMLDVENNALVALEMHVLKDALRAADVGDTSEVRHLAAMFVAVRGQRWARSSEWMRRMERALELLEGSAKYVEARYVGRAAELCLAGRLRCPGLCTRFDSLSAAGYLIEDFNDRLQNGAVQPPDVPRNRVYPTAASLGLLLDFLAVRWKGDVAEGREDFTLTGHLRSALGVPDGVLDDLVAEAKQHYAYGELRNACQNVVHAYLQDYEQARSRFEAQPGVRLQVQMPVSGTARSRSSRGKRWTIDEGKTVLGERYAVYTLSREDPKVFLKVQDRDVLEEIVGERDRRVSFFADSLRSIVVDGQSVAVGQPRSCSFQRLSLEGEGFKLVAESPGRLGIETGSVTVEVR